MAAAIGLPSDLPVLWLLSNQTFSVTVAFPRTESKAVDAAATETKARDVTYPVTPPVNDFALSHMLSCRSPVRRVIVS